MKTSASLRPLAAPFGGDELAHLAAQLQHHALGGALADALGQLDLRDIAPGDREPQPVGLVDAADREAHARTDAARPR